MDLSYFHQKDANGDVILNGDGGGLLREPKTKQLASLEVQINQGADTKTIDRFCNGIIELEQWDWLDSYNNCLTELAAVEAFNADLPVIGVDEDGVDIYAEAKESPVEPIRPTLQTLEGFKTLHAELFASYGKRQGIEIDGVSVSLNKDNSDGLVSIHTAYALVGDALFPTNFIADNASGTVSIPLADYTEFTAFALQFLAARGEFFK